jgi:hypothetical protein
MHREWMRWRGGASDGPSAEGEGPVSAWEQLTSVQADAVRATAAATGSDRDELPRELQPLLHIPRESQTDIGEPS